MIRYSLLWLFVSGVAVHAWRDWCKSLCVLVAMLAVLERPDMPKQMFGIQGLNPFNLTLAAILLAWGAQQLKKPVRWDAPTRFKVLVSLYLAVMALATFRMFRDPSFLLIWQHEAFNVSTRSALIADYVINTFKWIVPAVLIVQGCRGEERQRWLVVSLVGMYFVLAFLVIRQMPLMYLLDGDALQERAANVLQRRVGYHRVDLATMFAGASWAMIAARPLFASALIRVGLVAMSAVTVLGLALTAGRMGYAAWCVVGFVLSALKWRRYLVLAPVAVVLVLSFAPGIAQRMLQGLEGPVTNDAVVTSGRNLVWPFVVGKIAESPLVGFGRQAWVRTGLRLDVGIRTGEYVGHPHNAYLEFALDNGLIGMAILLPLLMLILYESVKLFRARDDLVANAVGGMTLAMTLSYAIAAVGAQTFYPTEGAVGMLCLGALTVRLAWDRAAVAKATNVTTEPARPTRGIALWPGSLSNPAARTDRSVASR